MTKQKFYEEMILKSYDHCYGTVLEDEAEKLSQLMNWPPESFTELMMTRDLMGFKLKIPSKHPFDKLGFKYLAQVVGFVARQNDDELTVDFFDFLNKFKDNKKMIDLNNDEHVEILYDSFYDTLYGEHSDHWFARKMADFILINCKNSKFHELVLKLAYAFAMTDKVGISDIVQMKREEYYKKCNIKETKSV